MKRYLLLLIMAAHAIGMQQPIVDEFYTAVREGNLVKVTSLASQPAVQNAMRASQQYATEAVLKFPSRFPDMTAKYMEIARFLVNQSAKIHPHALSALEAYEKSQKVICPTPAPAKARPLPIPVSQPMPMSKTPSPVPPSIKPSPTSSIIPRDKQPADFQTLEELLRQPIIGGQEIRNYINTHTLVNLSDKQRKDLTDTFLGVMRSLYVTSYDSVKKGLSTINFLLQNGFAATTDYQKNTLSGFRKGRFSDRAAQFPTALVEAIRDNKPLAEIKRLIEVEKEDVNQAGTDAIFPLSAAVSKGSKGTIEYLLSKGAQETDLLSFERQNLSKILGRTP